MYTWSNAAVSQEFLNSFFFSYTHGRWDIFHFYWLPAAKLFTQSMYLAFNGGTVGALSLSLVFSLHRRYFSVSLFLGYPKKLPPDLCLHLSPSKKGDLIQILGAKSSFFCPIASARGSLQSTFDKVTIRRLTYSVLFLQLTHLRTTSTEWSHSSL